MDGTSRAAGPRRAAAGRQGEGAEPSARERRIEEQLLHLRGLLFVRALLDHRGASDAELAWFTPEIARVRARLAAERSESYSARTTASLEAA